MKDSALRIVGDEGGREPIIVSDRFEVLGQNPIGKGTWGEVLC